MSLISKEAFMALSASTFITFFVPAIFIFALVFGVLSRIKILEDTKIEILISLVIGLLAAQFEFVQCVFLDVLPRFVIVMVLIFAFWVIAGLFLGEQKKGVNYFAIGALVLGFIFVFSTTTCPFNWSLGAWFFDNWPFLLGALAIIGLLIAILRQGKPVDYPKIKQPKSEDSDRGRWEPAKYDKVKQPKFEEPSPRTKKEKKKRDKKEKGEKESKDNKPVLTVKTIPRGCDVELSGFGIRNSGVLGRVKFRNISIGDYHLEVSKEGYYPESYRLYLDRSRKIVARLEKIEGEYEDIDETEERDEPEEQPSRGKKGPGMRINVIGDGEKSSKRKSPRMRINVIGDDEKSQGNGLNDLILEAIAFRNWTDTQNNPSFLRNWAHFLKWLKDRNYGNRESEIIDYFDVTKEELSEVVKEYILRGGGEIQDRYDQELERKISDGRTAKKKT